MLVKAASIGCALFILGVGVYRSTQYHKKFSFYAQERLEGQGKSKKRRRKRQKTKKSFSVGVEEEGKLDFKSNCSATINEEVPIALNGELSGEGENGNEEELSKLMKTPFNFCQVLSTELDVAKLYAMVKDPQAGAVVIFSGTTRQGSSSEPVTRLEYEAYESMAEKIMREICEEARVKWPDIINIAAQHKVGVCPVLDTSVLIAVSSGHRVAALEGARFIIDSIKTRGPIWKKEIYGFGKEAAWKENEEYFKKSIA